MQMLRIMQSVTVLPRTVTQQVPKALVVMHTRSSALTLFSPKPVGSVLQKQRNESDFQLRAAEDERLAHRMGLYIY